MEMLCVSKFRTSAIIYQNTSKQIKTTVISSIFWQHFILKYYTRVMGHFPVSIHCGSSAASFLVSYIVVISQCMDGCVIKKFQNGWPSGHAMHCNQKTQSETKRKDTNTLTSTCKPVIRGSLCSFNSNCASPNQKFAWWLPLPPTWQI